ncbi:MAG: hypothetical protein M3133_10125 [Actinomycetota bacterium]|nr:hypothetical protein [Actinomycetota bacterium]
MVAVTFVLYAELQSLADAGPLHGRLGEFAREELRERGGRFLRLDYLADAEVGDDEAADE